MVLIFVIFFILCIDMALSYYFFNFSDSCVHECVIICNLLSIGIGIKLISLECDLLCLACIVIVKKCE